MKKKSFLIFFLGVLFCSLFFPTSAQVNWQITDLQTHKCFIQNNGQLEDFQGNQVLYHSEFNGIEYFFTKNSFFMVHHSIKAKEIAASTQKTEEEIEHLVMDEDFIRYSFLSANKTVEISHEDEFPYYFSFSKSINKKRETIIAKGYKKITYTNIYPNIDLEFVFSEDRGLKYSFILRKGSTVDDIKIQIPNAKIERRDQHLLSIASNLGSVKDSLGSVYERQSLQPIPCSYTVKNNVVGFELPFEKISKTIILDPWVTTNLDVIPNRAYDVDFDSEGNIYAQIEKSGITTELVKLNGQGQILWVYQPGFDICYGDFAIDKSVNHIYLVEGYSTPGARVVKINKNAQELAFFQGDPFFQEMWRISFSKCDNRAVIAGGGVNSPTHQTCFLDTSLTQMTMVRYVNTNNCCHDVNMLALDEYGSCYQVTNRPAFDNDGLFDNQLVKLPLPNLLPVTYSVSSGYNFTEISNNLLYISGMQQTYENGYNGIATINNKVYTTNGYKVTRWDGTNGAVLNRFSIDTCCSGIDSTYIFWCGIAVDACENLFVGHRNEILHYDSLLNLVNTIPYPDTITDLVLGLNNDLLVAGYNSVGKISLQTNPNCQYAFIDIEPNVIASTCTEKGSVSIQIFGGTPPYDIIWNTTPPQYGNVATNLNPGLYTVTVNDSKCKGIKVTDTVEITGTTGLGQLISHIEPVNVFTPNNDGVNPVFIPFLEIIENQNYFSSLEYTLEIFNRWGNKVFETLDPNTGWNGKTGDGTDSSEGVYFWKLSMKTDCDEDRIEKQGFLHLVR
ncbi:MAG: hypothetical protein RL632_782 [Bacteroidota bacterium]